MAKVTYVLAQGENSAGESQVNFRVYVSRELRVRVPSGIWVDRKRWGKKNDINIPNIPGEERDALLAKRAKLKELVDVIETSVEAADDKSTVTREWLEKLIRRTLRPKTATSVEEKKIGFFPLTDEYLATHKLSESRVKHFNVLVRTLKRYELYRKLSNRRFVLDVHTVSPTTLDDFGAFLMKEPEIFDEHPELYDEVPYARPKVRKNLPVKRGPYLNAAGETVIPGRPKERGMNYVSDMLIRLRSFYVWLNDNGHTYNDPFKQYKIAEIVYGTPIYITTDERKQLAEADMGDDKQLETQRDIFVFQCMIGCRVSDLYKMTYANIIVDISLDKLDKTFQYAIPPELQEQIHPGVQVDIPFGKRTLTGYVVEVTEEPEFDVDKIRPLIGIHEGSVPMESQLIEMAAWIRKNYGSTMNQIGRASCRERV